MDLGRQRKGPDKAPGSGIEDNHCVAFLGICEEFRFVGRPELYSVRRGEIAGRQGEAFALDTLSDIDYRDRLAGNANFEVRLQEAEV